MPKVAVIDDSPIVLRGVKLALEPRGWTVSLFDNKFGVSNEVIKDAPDVVLIDMNMPLLNGAALLRSLRRGNMSAKLLFHSDQDIAELQKAATENNADGYIAKTGDGAALDKALRRFVR
jgi:DNA-binding NarL/FixJ family response regulator